MIPGSCHCGAIRLEVAVPPEHLIDCNCSICRRYGALWAHYASGAVKISGQLDRLSAYVWGRRSIRTMHCATCGCVTHWEPVSAQSGAKFGINMRNFDPVIISGAEIRKFDGADTWSYLE